MGWVPEVIGNKQELFHDWTLLIVSKMVYARWVVQGRRQVAVARFIERWPHEWKYWGPGVVDLQLPAIYENHVAATELVELLDQVEQDLLAVGPVIPRQTMRKEWAIEGIAYTADQPTAPMIDVARRVRALMTHDHT